MIQKNNYRKYAEVMMIITVILTIMAGCSREHSLITNTEEGDGTFISVSMQFGKAKISTRSFYDYISTLPEEDMVYEIRLVFYSAKTGMIVKTVDLDACNVDDRNNPTTLVPFYGRDVLVGEEDWFMSNAIEFTGEELEAGEYHMVVIANPNDDIKTRTDMGSQMTLEDFENEIIEYDEQKMTGIDHNRFMMINYFGSSKINRKLNFWDTEDKAEKGPVEVRIARQVAMVLPYLAQLSRSAVSELPVYFDNILGPTEYWSYDDIEAHNVAWEVNVINRKMYWMRKPTAGEDSYDPQNWYSIDPNFQKGLSEANDGSLTNRQNNFQYITKEQVDNGRPLTWLNDIYNISSDYVYIPENTMEATEQYGDVMTSVVIGLNIVRTNQSGGGVASRNAVDFEHWIYLNFGDSKMLSPVTDEVSEQLAEIYQMYNNPDVWDKENDKLIQIPGKNLTEDELLNLGNTFKIMLNGIKYMIDHFGYDGSSQGPNWDAMESFEVGNFTFYKGGRMYYTIPISHLGTYGNSPGMYRKYGVVRNNAYLLQINSVAGPGAISPDPPLIPQSDVILIDSYDWDEINNNFNFGGVEEN